jgi:cytochrome c
MKMIKTAIVAAGIAGMLMGAANVAADGAALYTQKLCMTCHGADAKTPIAPTYPKLAGQSSVYCQQQVKDIKSGKRNNGMTAAMKPLVAAVTDEEITAICDYVAGL